MGKKNKDLALVISITLVVFIACIIGINEYSNYKVRTKYNSIKRSIENIFFYLPEDEYTDLNKIPDYCKISMVYGYNTLKNSKYVSTKDFTTFVKKNNKNKAKAYKLSDIEKAIKTIIGNDATVNYDKDIDGDYTFITENGCGFNNDNIGTLGYNEKIKYIYSLDKKDTNSSKVYVKWLEEKEDDDIVKLSAYAFDVVESNDGSYTVYADANHNYIAGTIAKGKDIEKELEQLYETKSRLYTFELKKIKRGYRWLSYKVIDNIYNTKVYVD